MPPAKSPAERVLEKKWRPKYSKQPFKRLWLTEEIAPHFYKMFSLFAPSLERSFLQTWSILKENLCSFFVQKREKVRTSSAISTLIFAPSTLLTCQVEHQIFNFELREHQREIGVENVVNTKYLVVMNVKIKLPDFWRTWTSNGWHQVNLWAPKLSPFFYRRDT